MSIVGLISPGAMGASVGAAAAQTGNTVLWAGDDRGDATRERAARANLEDCGSIANMATRADIILSVCPPHDAENVAASVINAGFKGLYLEGNAISPVKTRAIEAELKQADIEMVDGGIVGGPAWTADAGTMLYLSGERADEIAALFVNSPLGTTIINTDIGAASAMKMCFAAYTKGSIALLTAILGVAEREGVRSTLETQWGEKFSQQTHRQVTTSSAKAWRFAGEMREIAETFAGAGLPGGFHLGAAEVFEQLSAFKDDPAKDMDALLLELLKR